MRKMRPVKERFEEKFTVLSNDCWRWDKSFDTSGYGCFYLHGRLWRAHRAAVFIYQGIDLGELNGCHSCDNRWCVNPDHIFAGTQKDNLDDMKSKGRQKIGDHSKDKNGRAKISQNMAEEIRTLYGLKMYKQKELAAIYGIGQSQVSRIIRREQR